MPTSPFPHRYTSTITRTDRGRARVEAAPRPALDGGPPPEFGGVETTWSPEHLLASSLGLCLFTTFEALAARAKLELVDWRCETEAVVDKTSAGLGFSAFTIVVDLVVAPGDVERARELLEKAHGFCMVSKALRFPVELTARVAAAASAA